MPGLTVALLIACTAAPDGAPQAPSRGTSMQISSPAFKDGADIPAIHTCQGSDLAPALAWSDAPAATRSFAVIVDDPDAPDPAKPRMTWVHWVLYNLPAEASGLPEGGSPLPPGTLEGRNDWKRTGYGGPCPPIGRHRYFHKLYALDTLLPDLHEPTKDVLLAAMKGHVLAEAQLIGGYHKR